jgi:hypothetical protein
MSLAASRIFVHLSRKARCMSNFTQLFNFFRTGLTVSGCKSRKRTQVSNLFVLGMLRKQGF